MESIFETGWTSRLMEAFPAFILDATLKSAVILLLALGVARLLRKSSAALRYFVWLGALTAMLALPVMHAVLPDWGLSLATKSKAREFIFPGNISPNDREMSHLYSAPVSENVSFIPIEQSAETKATRSIPWESLVFLGWFLGVVVVGGIIISSHGRVFRLVRSCEPIRDSSWTDLGNRIAAELGITKPVRLLRASDGVVPKTWGWRKPVIILPREADEWDEDQRLSVLRHEMGHIRRNDCLGLCIGHLAVAIYWMNPLVWLAMRRMRLEQEKACDDLVVTAGSNAREYANHLLGIARESKRMRFAAMAGIAVVRRSNLEVRIKSIINPETNRKGVTKMTKRTLLITTLLLTIPLAMATLKGQVSPERVTGSDPTVQPESANSEGQNQESGYSEHQKKIYLTLLLKSRATLIQNLLNGTKDYSLARETASELLSQFQKTSLQNTSDPDFKVFKDFIESEIDSLIGTLDSIEKIRNQLSSSPGENQREGGPSLQSLLFKYGRLADSQTEGIMQLIPNLEEHVKTQTELASRLADAEKRLAEATAQSKNKFPAQSITVTGAVTQPQIVTLGKDQKINILQAITMAGGFNRYANTMKIRVIRPNEKEREFSVDEIRESLSTEEDIFYLQDKDNVIVEERRF